METTNPIDQVKFQKHYIAVVREVEELKKMRGIVMELQALIANLRAELDEMKKTVHSHSMLLVDFDSKKATSDAFEFHKASMPHDPVTKNSEANLKSSEGLEEDSHLKL